MQMPAPVPQFSVAMRDNPMLFGFRHGENEPENFSLLTGELADFQSANCNQFSLLRVVPREEWEQCGFFVEEHEVTRDGLKTKEKVVLEKANKTAKVLEDRKRASQKVVDIKEVEASAMEKRQSELEEKIRRLEALLEKNSEYLLEQSAANARAQGEEEMKILAEQSAKVKKTS